MSMIVLKGNEETEYRYRSKCTSIIVNKTTGKCQQKSVACKNSRKMGKLTNLNLNCGGEESFKKKRYD